MRFRVDDMALPDIPQVVEVDRESYPVPWPSSAYRRELNNNRNARYIVLKDLAVEQPATPPSALRRNWLSLLRRSGSSVSGRAGSRGRVIGYAGMWIVADEAHITTIAVRSSYRGFGFGELLLASLIDSALGFGIRWVTLEVRVTNTVAQSLYRKYGFRNSGLRKRYYSDNNEDAVIMTTDDITLNAYKDRFNTLCEQLRNRFNGANDAATGAPVLLGQ